MTSPYLSVADTLRDRGYHVLPCMPGSKVPGEWRGSAWEPMRQWSAYCEKMPVEFLHTKWQEWPDAGVCMAHGAVVGLDIDTDRQDVAAAAVEAVGASPVRRKGAKGWMGYYRVGDAAQGHAARVRWYDNAGAICVELLLHGTQSVLPPTIHPGTGQPYRWLTPDSLEDYSDEELPELPADAVARLDAAFGKLGLVREKPRKANIEKWVGQVSGLHDLEKTWGRSLNDRAMEADAIDQWFPALGLPKTRQRGHGAWEAVAEWRPSSSGRAMADRNPNLRIVPGGPGQGGARDFGGGTIESYTPVNLVIAARSCTVKEAAEFLEQYIRPEDGVSVSEVISVLKAQIPGVDVVTAEEPDHEVQPGRRSASRFTERRGGRDKPKSRQMTSRREFMDAFPEEVPPFPVQDFETDLTGLLRETTLYIDESSNMRSEQGAFGAAIAALGVLMGKKIEVAETGLRTNLYVIGTADSGAGKSSAMVAMTAMITRCGVDDRLVGTDFSSGSAILKEMNDHVPSMFTVDEFGDVMRRVLSSRAASHEREIGRIMKDLYSSSNGVYKGKAKATESRRDIVEPHLCIYGVSTHEAFWESLDGRSFNDGLLARFIMIPIGDTEPQTPKHDRAKMVVDMVSEVVSARYGSGNLSDNSPAPVKFSAGIFQAWNDDRVLFQMHANRAEKMKLPGAPSIINRICENAMKIAMISAMGRNPAAPEVSGEDYELGIGVAHWSAIYMINSIAKYYVENATHKDLNRVMEFISSAGADGRTKADVYRRFKGIFVTNAARSIIDTLKVGQSIVEWIEPSGGGRPTTWYVDTKHAIEFLSKREDNSEAQPK